ncbi:hypothetical protein CRG98_003656 [Punica granatum]|uniref:Uncharacterized protein n=1 Tax=Punica granatum TaxID=22663 RepID=A0A2I0L5I8_PUNGR|nr:hypothetical protein CRG98_003656 [Punica granatum]
MHEARARLLGVHAAQEITSHGLADPARLQEARTRWLGELRCRKVNSRGVADPAGLQEARARWLGEHAVQESCKRHERGGSANLRCKKVNSHGLAVPSRLHEARARLLGVHAAQEITSHGLADPARLQEARARWLGELAVQESKLARTQQGCKRHERGGSANLRCKKVNSHGLAVPSRLHEARARLLGVHAAQEITSHGLADPARLQEARARWLGELAVQESKLARTQQGCKRHERGGSANLRCKKVNSHGLAVPSRLHEARARLLGVHAAQEITSHGLADPARLQEARARWLGELAVQESKLARTQQGCKRHERGGSANLRCKKVNSHGLAVPSRLHEARARLLGVHAAQEITSHGLADPARLQEARARWLGELAVQESKLARTQQGCKRHERGGSANLRCKKVNSHGLAVPSRLHEARARLLGVHAAQEITSHGLADPARLQEARARWLGELAVQESKLARTQQGCKRHERGGSANLRCKKVNSHGLAVPSRLHEARARLLGVHAAQEITSHGLADPARLQEARARWLGELAVQESKLARTQQGCKRHERGGSANLRCKKVNSHGLAVPSRLHEARARLLGVHAAQEITSHGLADPARLQEARARWLGELAVQESKLARTQQGCKRHERGGSANLRCKKVNSHGLAVPSRLHEARARLLGVHAAQEITSHGLADPARLQEARARWLGELAEQGSHLARISKPGKARARWLDELRSRKVYSDGLADPARLQEARARWLGELRSRKVYSDGLADPARLQEARARWLGELRSRKVYSDGLADPARLQEARARWLAELAVLESNLARVSRPDRVPRGTNEMVLELAVQESKLARVTRPGMVARGTNEVGRRTCGGLQGCKRHEGGGSANLRCTKVNSHGLPDPAWLQEARTRWVGELAEVCKVARGTSEVARRTCGIRKKVRPHELADRARLHKARARWLGELRCGKVYSDGLADPARLQEARARWLGEFAVQESKLARLNRLGKIRRGTSEVARRTCGGRKKVISHGIADPARLREARTRWFGEFTVQESSLARISRPGKLARGTSEVARRNCGSPQGCRRHERGCPANLRCKKVNSHRLAAPIRLQEPRARWLGELRCRKVYSDGLADPARLQEAGARWLGELAVQESILGRASRPGKVVRCRSGLAR